METLLADQWHRLLACEDSTPQAGSLCHFGRFQPTACLITLSRSNIERLKQKYLDWNRDNVAPNAKSSRGIPTVIDGMNSLFVGLVNYLESLSDRVSISKGEKRRIRERQTWS